MAPVVAATPNHNPTKIKRPPPPGIQTNGVSSSRSSPSQSPSMSVKRTPTAGAKQQQQMMNGAAVNGVNGAASRPGTGRPRREPSTQAAGRGGRANGLRSASQALDSFAPQMFEPRPEVITDRYILKKHAGNPPSLIIHLYPTHFRFDQQDGIFPIKSPMGMILDHIRNRTIPHDILPSLTDAGVTFYDGCLIVQIFDHKSTAQAKDVARPTSASSKTTPFSIHNYNPYITPSPYTPYPKENLNGASNEPAASGEVKSGEVDSNDKENMPAPAVPEAPKSKSPPKPKVSTVVLHPTPQSLNIDLMIKATTPQGSGDARAGENGSMIPPPTPMSAVPPTPTGSSMAPPAKRLKKERMELDCRNIHEVEAQILLATAAPLHLEPTKNAKETIALLELLADDKHSEPPPMPKTRKRTVAERAADEALAADHEKYMLTFDERLSSNQGGTQGGADGGEGPGQSGGAAFEPRFERFKLIEELKRGYAEKQEQEKLRRDEQDRKLALQKQQQQADLAAARQAEQEKARREQDAAARLQRQQQQDSQRRMAQQQQAQAQAQAHAQAAAAQAQAQAQAAAAQSPPNMQHQMSQASHGHPTPGSMPNPLPAHRFPQQVSQAPVSSPVVRQGTPQNISSPMVNNVPMQQTNSGMGASPARPSSVVQNHPPMSAPMSVSMSARGSQQSHPSGTPRMPSATPQMAHGTPINRPMQTPRLTQASPPPAMMAQNSQMGQAMLMGNQNVQQQMPPMVAAQIAAQQQRQRIAAQQQIAAMQNGMMNGQNPQQQMQNFQQMQQQHLVRQQMMNMNMNSAQVLSAAQQAQMAQRYQQQVNMQQQQQVHQQQQQQQHMPGQMGNPNFMNANGMNQAQMVAALQQQQQQQQMQHPGQQQQQQQQQMMTAQARSMQQLQLQKQQQIYQSNIQVFANQYGGAIQNIPPDQLQNFKRQCMMKAREWVANTMRERSQAILQQQQQQQHQQNMQNGVNGGVNGMMQGM